MSTTKLDTFRVDSIQLVWCELNWVSSLLSLSFHVLFRKIIVLISHIYLQLATLIQIFTVLLNSFLLKYPPSRFLIYFCFLRLQLDHVKVHNLLYFCSQFVVKWFFFLRWDIWEKVQYWISIFFDIFQRSVIAFSLFYNRKILLMFGFWAKWFQIKYVFSNRMYGEFQTMIYHLIFWGRLNSVQYSRRLSYSYNVTKKFIFTLNFPLYIPFNTKMVFVPIYLIYNFGKRRFEVDIIQCTIHNMHFLSVFWYIWNFGNFLIKTLDIDDINALSVTHH